MRDSQHNLFHDFDCTMITVLLGLNLTRNEIMKIANKFLNENGEKSRNFALCEISQFINKTTLLLAFKLGCPNLLE